MKLLRVGVVVRLAGLTALVALAARSAAPEEPIAHVAGGDEALAVATPEEALLGATSFVFRNPLDQPPATHTCKLDSACASVDCRHTGIDDSARLGDTVRAGNYGELGLEVRLCQSDHGL